MTQQNIFMQIICIVSTDILTIKAETKYLFAFYYWLKDKYDGRNVLFQVLHIF